MDAQAPITLANLIGVTSVATAVLLGVGGVLYNGIRSRIDTHGQQIDTVMVGMVEVKGMVETSGAHLNGRIDVLSEHVSATNGRLTRAEEDLHAMRPQ